MRVLIFLVVAISLSLPSFASIDSGYPQLFFSYSWLYDDAVCREPVDSEWAKEASARELEFEKTWKASAPTLMRTVFDRFEGRFSRKEMTATLSACPKTFSYSSPLVLRVSRFLKSYRGQNPVNPDHAFVVLVFHELMHTWVDENLRGSLLLVKYASESRTVRNHLHLMALEKFAFTQAGRWDMLQWIESTYPLNPEYRRAWEIVQMEGAETFLAEFRSSR